MARIEIDSTRSVNRDRLLRLLRVHGQMARIDLARLVGLSPATVSAISSELLQNGLVREVEADDDSDANGSRGRGRPKVMIDLVARTACIIAVKLSINEIQVALGDFSGGVSETESTAIETRTLSAAELVRAMGDAIADFHARHTTGYGPCLGIGIAVQGLVRSVETLVWSPALAARDVNIVRPLAGRFGLPVVMMNDANSIASAVRNRARFHDVENLAVVMLGTGVGMGLILGGHLYDGSTGAAAEFGHSKFQIDGPLCMCGKRGCIESYVADYALHRDARIMFGLPAVNVQHPSESEMRAISDLADGGDERAQKLFEQAGRVLGCGIGNLIALVSPDLVLVTGPGVRAYRHLEAGLRHGLSEAMVETLLTHTRIEPLPWQEDLALRGVVGLVLDRVPAP
ncbi:MAG TPA: ROK family protein [Magnetospirillaceae bacterium]|jgi:predicted NBD/HSP70 family sugar kinase